MLKASNTVPLVLSLISWLLHSQARPVASPLLLVWSVETTLDSTSKGPHTKAMQAALNATYDYVTPDHFFALFLFAAL